MADNVAVTEGSGKTIASDDVGGAQYQRVKIGVGTDGVATDVSTTNPMPITVANSSGTLGVYLDSTAGTVNVQLKPGTIAVQLDPGHTLGTVISNVGTGTMAVFFDQSAPTVKAIPSTGTFTVAFDPGHELGSIKGSNSSIAVFFDRANPNVLANAGTGTFNVQFDPGHTLGNIASIGSITNTVAVFFSPASPAVSATFSAASIEVVPTTGSRKTMDDAHAAQRVLIVGSQTAASLAISSISSTVAVFFSPANPSVNATFSSTSLEVVPSTGSRNITDSPSQAMRVLIAGSQSNASIVISSIATTVAVFFSPANPSVSATFSAASIEVIPTTGSRKITDDAAAAMRVLLVGTQTNASLTINGTVTANAGTGTMTVKFDPGYTLGKVDAGAGTFNVQFDPGHTIGNIATLNSIATTVTVKLDPGNTLGKVDQGVTGVSAWLTNSQHTASIFTVSGSTSGVSASGVQLVAPSANASFKVFAFSLQTTGIVSTVARFTNGGGSATEFWRGLVTSNQTSSAPIGANLAVMPPGHLFATGTSTTLALHLDTATLVHYSVSYFKESA